MDILQSGTGSIKQDSQGPQPVGHPSPLARRLSAAKGDFLGGITAGIIALPLALAFGVASGVGAEAGLYGAIILGLLAALFGGTRTQISGPTGPMTVITAAALVSFNGDFGAVLAAVLVAGLLQIVFGLCKLGGFVKFVPYPVISGFMSGIGVIIMLLQIHPLLGSDSVSSPLAAVTQLPSALSTINIDSVIIGLLTMAIVFWTPARVSRILPSPLIALLGVSTLAFYAGFDVKTIGEIPASLPEIRVPHFSLEQVSKILSTGISLAILGTIDSLLTSLVADSLTRESHNSNRELIGQGIGNAMASLFGGIAGAGATMRTVVNIKAGGTSRLSGAVHALFLVSILMGLGSLASHIPLAVLAGILIKVGVDILDYRLLKVFKKAPIHDLSVMLVVFVITVFVDLMVAVGVGITLSALLLTYRIAKQTRIQVFERGGEDEADSNADTEIQKSTDFGIRVIQIQGPFFFGSTTQVVAHFDSLLGTKVVIFNCLEVPFMDLSAVFALDEMICKLQAKGVESLIVSRERTRKKLLGLGFGAKFGESSLFVDHDEVLAAARAILK